MIAATIAARDSVIEYSINCLPVEYWRQGPWFPSNVPHFRGIRPSYAAAPQAHMTATAALPSKASDRTAVTLATLSRNTLILVTGYS